MSALKIILKVLGLIFCGLMICSGAVNIGFSGFFFALPFVVISLALAKSLHKYLMFFFLGLSLLGFVVNKTIESNPMVFPVLEGGEVTIEQDGYLVTFFDDSGGFWKKDQWKKEDEDKWVKSVKPVSKGDRFKVLKIKVGHPDFSTKINLQTTGGEINHRDISEGEVSINKQIYNDQILSLSVLMYYPVLPILWK